MSEMGKIIKCFIFLSIFSSLKSVSLSVAYSHSQKKGVQRREIFEEAIYIPSHHATFYIFFGVSLLSTFETGNGFLSIFLCLSKFLQQHYVQSAGLEEKEKGKNKIDGWGCKVA